MKMKNLKAKQIRALTPEDPNEHGYPYAFWIKAEADIEWEKIKKTLTKKELKSWWKGIVKEYKKHEDEEERILFRGLEYASSNGGTATPDELGAYHANALNEYCDSWRGEKVSSFDNNLDDIKEYITCLINEDFYLEESSPKIDMKTQIISCAGNDYRVEFHNTNDRFHFVHLGESE